MIKLSRLKLAELEDKFSILSKEEQEATFYSLLKDTNYNYKRMAIYSPSLYSYSYLKK